MDGLDLRYRQMIGAETSDLLLKRGVHLDLLFAKEQGVMAVGRMGGYECWHDSIASKTLCGHGETKAEAAAALLTGGNHPTPNLKSSLWAMGEVFGLLAEAMGDNRQHEYKTCDKGKLCPEGSCHICDGGLLDCIKCGQAEGELEGYCNGSR